MLYAESTLFRKSLSVLSSFTASHNAFLDELLSFLYILLITLWLISGNIFFDIKEKHFLESATFLSLVFLSILSTFILNESADTCFIMVSFSSMYVISCFFDEHVFYLVLDLKRQFRIIIEYLLNGIAALA